MPTPTQNDLNEFASAAATLSKFQLNLGKIGSIGLIPGVLAYTAGKQSGMNDTWAIGLGLFNFLTTSGALAVQAPKKPVKKVSARLRDGG